MQTTILQPTYLPWLGYFEMIDAAEQFVVFDHVQFESSSWQSRNRIAGPNGVLTLSVPVLSDGTENIAICQKRIDYKQRWVHTHVRSIECAYRRAPYFDQYFEGLRAILSSRPERLVDLTLPLIRYIADCLGIQTTFRRSSDMVKGEEAQLDKTGRLLSVCQLAGATLLYDGAAAASFLDTGRFAKCGIEVVFQDYFHPVYRQVRPGFTPNLSAVDLLFNCGNESLNILRAGLKRTCPATA
jgi:WbqC-like protein family